MTARLMPLPLSSTIPEDCVYDGEAHAAIVELVKGDGVLTVTYVKDARDAEASTDAPVVPGTYSVVVTVTETDHYYGLEATIGSFTISKAPCVFDVIVPEDVEHDGEGHPATVIVTQGGEPIVTYLNTKTDVISADDPVDIGEYYVIVEIPETDLYEGLPSTMFGPFVIYSGTTGLQEIGAARESDNAWYTIQGNHPGYPRSRSHCSRYLHPQWQEVHPEVISDCFCLKFWQSRSKRGCFLFV